LLSFAITSECSGPQLTLTKLCKPQHAISAVLSKQQLTSIAISSSCSSCKLGLEPLQQQSSSTLLPHRLQATTVLAPVHLQ
jgi:hypothetical protein